jgi:hypothetical protein
VVLPQEREVRVTVMDLHAIVPHEFLSFSAAVVHPLSYNHARNYQLPVSQPGGASRLCSELS